MVLRSRKPSVLPLFGAGGPAEGGLRPFPGLLGPAGVDAALAAALVNARGEGLFHDGPSGSPEFNGVDFPLEVVARLDLGVFATEASGIRDPAALGDGAGVEFRGVFCPGVGAVGGRGLAEGGRKEGRF